VAPVLTVEHAGVLNRGNGPVVSNAKQALHSHSVASTLLR
jgi:hypothetical protein